MLDQYKPEELKAALAALRSARGEPGNLEAAIKKHATGRVLAAACWMVSEQTRMPDFMLDMYEGDRDAALESAERALADYVAEKEHPDCLPELLAGARDFGFVHVPVDLLRDLYELGVRTEAVRRKEGRAADVEPIMLRVLERSADWAIFCMRTWGVPPDGRLVAVRPLTEEDVRKAAPIDSSDPPF